MEYYATDHLKERLLERNITEKDVEECLAHHHTDYPVKGNEHCTWYVGTIKGRKLRVMVDNEDNTLVTAYWLSK